MVEAIERATDLGRSRIRDQLAGVGNAPVYLSGLRDRDFYLLS
jgi:hypothetical protein